jgi:hypothetical protein
MQLVDGDFALGPPPHACLRKWQDPREHLKKSPLTEFLSWRSGTSTIRRQAGMGWGPKGEITIDQLEIFSGFSSGLGKNPEHPYCLQILDIPFYSTVECLLKSALCVQLGVVVLLILHCYFPLALQRGMRPQPLVATTRVFVTDRLQGFTANSIRRSSVKSW